MPLLVQHELIGTLNLSVAQSQVLTPEYIAIAREIGNTLAVALHNATLVESLQQELEARTRAEQALVAEHKRVVQLKNEFMATMSHELRTPLSAVLGRAEALSEQIYGPLTVQQQAVLKNIDESGRHLLALINDILDYSKFEAGQIALECVPTNVTEICSACLRLVTQTARGKQIRLTSTFDMSVEMICADGKRLQQILINLLTNAIKFTPLGGKVGLEVHGNAANHTATFTVWDTGIGIAREDLPRLFQPFTQLDSRLNRMYEGTGLGLALVRRIAEAHGGSADVESTLGVGSHFSVTLPWDASEPGRLLPKPSGLPTISTPPIGAALPVILLVEDHESTIALLYDILSPHGYDLIVARTGDEGVALARTIQPALVLVDIQLPGMSGLEVTQHLRADRDVGHIPIVALTALAMPGDRERCMAAGVDEYLSKPVSMHTLLETIATQLARIRPHNYP